MSIGNQCPTPLFVDEIYVAGQHHRYANRTKIDGCMSLVIHSQLTRQPLEVHKLSARRLA